MWTRGMISGVYNLTQLAHCEGEAEIHGQDNLCIALHTTLSHLCPVSTAVIPDVLMGSEKILNVFDQILYIKENKKKFTKT